MSNRQNRDMELVAIVSVVSWYGMLVAVRYGRHLIESVGLAWLLLGHR